MSNQFQAPENSVEEDPRASIEPVKDADGKDWVFDSHGWPVWRRDLNGEITYFECDPPTGNMKYLIRDVNLFLFNIEMLTAGRNVRAPADWKAPVAGGSHHISVYEYDALHRLIRHESWQHYDEMPVH